MKSLIQAFEQAPKFLHLQALLESSCWSAPKTGMFLEFGVGGGTTIRIIAGVASRCVYGFDSFFGLPEAWADSHPQGHFNNDGVEPDGLPTNVVLVKGLFSDTVPAFFAEHPGPVAFAHIDCDIYSSTKTALDGIAPRVIPGTVLVFNEFWNYKGAEDHEAKAFAEFISQYGFDYECLGRSSDAYTQATFRLK